ncbi:MAG: DUF6162 family protein [Desulfovibrio sp.]
MSHGANKKIIHKTVRPIGAGVETKWVLSAACATLLICSLSIGFTTKSSAPKDYQSWQIDAYAELNSEQLSIVTALNSAAPEIEAIHMDELIWPTVQNLKESFTPPFIHDSAWLQNGQLQWKSQIGNTADIHRVLYMGTPSTTDDQMKIGTFLLVMLHKHNAVEAGEKPHPPYEIWLNSAQKDHFPKIVTDQGLSVGGWREVVSKTGADEAQKSKGSEYLSALNANKGLI